MDRTTVKEAAHGKTTAADPAPQHRYALLLGQKRVLELIATGAPLDDTLTELIHFIEAQEEGLRCGILVVADGGQHFRRVYGPSLPEIYHQTLEGISIVPPYPGACGEAAHRGELVAAADIGNESRWSERWRKLALSCGLEAVLSTPVRAADGRVLAAFAMYYGQPRDPRPAEPELIEIATHLTGIAIEREQSEAAKRSNEAWLRATLQGGGLGVWELDLATGTTKRSSSHGRIFGYETPLPEWTYETFLQHVLPEDRPTVDRRFREAIETGGEWHFECRIEPACGGLRWIEAHGSPVANQDGQVVRLLGTIADITSRKQAEAAARESERQAREVLDALPAAVYMTDADGNITFYNQSAVKLAGRQPELGRDKWCVARRLYWPDGKPLPHDHNPIAITLKENRAIAGVEACAERPDGTRVPFLAFPTPLRNAAGALTGAVNMLIDITDRKQAENALRATDERLTKELAGMQRLQALSVQLIQEDDVDALYQQVLDAAIAIMDSDAASVQMLHPDRDQLRLLASKGFHPHSQAFWEWVSAGSGSSCGAALAAGERIVVQDLEACDFVAGTRDQDEYRRSGIRAVQSTPLISRSGRALGMISTHWHEPHQPGEQYLWRLDMLARQAADLIERKQAEEAQQQLTARLEALYRVSRTLAGDLDLDRIIQAVTDSATELSGAQFGAFFYKSGENGSETFKLRALAGMPHGAFARFGMPRNSSIFGVTFRGEGIVRSDDIREDPRYGKNAPHHGPPQGHPPVVSYLAVPVVSRAGEVVGSVCLGHGEAGVFTRDAEDIVAGIVTHAAVAIDNARLFDAAQKEIARSRRVERAAQQLAAIVKSSEDAIVSKDLDGIILTWNHGAQRLFGYTAEEAVGQPVTILMPEGHSGEEPQILSRIRHGQAVEHYETVRRRKDGTLIDIALTVSPIRNSRGRVIGASKIARDISERRKADRHRTLLLHELSHRVKNSLATVQSIAVQTLQNAPTPAEFQATFMARLIALAHTHDLLMRSDWSGATLRDLIATELAPYRSDDTSRWSVAGNKVHLDAKTALSLGMALHELATNAAKYGALSNDGGRLEINWRLQADDDGQPLLRLVWAESGGPPVAEPTRRGFGSRLIEQGLRHELRARVRLEFRPAGVRCAIDVPLETMATPTPTAEPA